MEPRDVVRRLHPGELPPRPLPRPRAALRARGEVVAAAEQLWERWPPAGVAAAADAGVFAFRGRQVDIAGAFTVPRSPQGRPVLLQAGDSEEGREFAARHADGIFTRHGTLEAGQAF